MSIGALGHGGMGAKQVPPRCFVRMGYADASCAYPRVGYPIGTGEAAVQALSAWYVVYVFAVFCVILI